MVDHRFRKFNNITEVMMSLNQSSVLTKHIQHFFNNSILQELNTINATSTPEPEVAARDGFKLKLIFEICSTSFLFYVQ